MKSAWTILCITVLCLGLEGCFSIEQSHFLESKADGLETSPSDLGTVYVLKLDTSTTVYLKIQAYKKLDSKCIRGIGIVPTGGKSGTEQNQPSNYVAIGIKTDRMLGSMDFDQVSLDYMGKSYSIDGVETWYASKRTKEHQQLIQASNRPEWFKARFPINIDVRNNFKLTIGGFSYEGREIPPATTIFSPYQVAYTANYGERGC